MWRTSTASRSAAVVGDADDETVRRWGDQIDIVSLTDLFGVELALAEPKQCIQRAVEHLLAAR